VEGKERSKRNQSFSKRGGGKKKGKMEIFGEELKVEMLKEKGEGRTPSTLGKSPLYPEGDHWGLRKERSDRSLRLKNLRNRKGGGLCYSQHSKGEEELHRFFISEGLSSLDRTEKGGKKKTERQNVMIYDTGGGRERQGSPSTY